MAAVNLEQFLRHPDNSKCADCGAPHDEYISLNFGVTLCEQCATLHNTEEFSYAILPTRLVTHIYFLSLLPYAGNKNFADFMSAYKVDAAAPPEFKYRIRAAHVYQSLLNQAPRTKTMPVDVELIPLEEALEVLPPNRDWEGASIVQKAMWSATDVTTGAGESLVENLNEFTKTPLMHAIESTTLGFLTRLESNINWLFGMQGDEQSEVRDVELHPI